VTVVTVAALAAAAAAAVGWVAMDERARARRSAAYVSGYRGRLCTRTRLSGRIMGYVGVAEHNHVDSVFALHGCTVAMVLSVRRRRSSRIYQDHEAHTHW
jgi:hypothetical protein